MAIYRGSRYQNTTVYNHVADNNTLPTLSMARTVPTLRRREISRLNDSDSTLHTFRQGDRIDSLAYQYYGDAQLWWVILDANPRYMTPWDVMPGDILTIPSYQEIRRGLGV